MLKYESLLQSDDPVFQLHKLSEMHRQKIAFSTSFGLEDQVISHLIFAHNIPIKVFTLDTGRLFPETYKVWADTLEKYKQPIEAYYPDTTQVEEMVSKKGPTSFYQSVENRKECCAIRKVVPLKRALHNTELWVTGLRADQSSARSNLAFFEYDESFGLVKFNPLKDWTYDRMMQYLKTHNIPYNSLHDKGFVSIGCQPCTRAIKEGEDFRAGRWWWETSSKECGLHATRPNGKTIEIKKM